MKELIKRIMRGAALILEGLIQGTRALADGARALPPLTSEKNILVMGNAPSLNSIDLVRVDRSRFDLLCVNSFACNEQLFFELKPEYYCIVDPAFFCGSEPVNGNRRRLFDALRKVDWHMKIIIPAGCRPPVDNERLSYIHVTRRELHFEALPAFRNFLYRRNLCSCGMQNVIVAALSYLICAKAKAIYMAGVDISEFKGLYIDENNEVLVETNYFYGTVRCKFSDMPLEPGEFYKVLECYVRMFRQFHVVAGFAQAQGVKIYNLSKSSYVDSFERLDSCDILY